MNRKKFLKTTTMLSMSTLLSGVVSANTAKASLRVGLIGAHGMGWSNLLALLNVEGVVCTAVCDVDENVLQERVAALQEKGCDVTAYIDYTKMLASEEVDAVIIATPDHWHCLQFVDALSAGKHVYVEKPIGNSMAECDVMVRASHASDKVVQVGQWQRSQQHFKEAIDYVHSGKLGNIRLVKAWSYVDWKTPIKPQADGEVPAGVYYDRWLGPARSHPFNPNRFHFEFRWFWDYAGGLMTDWGVHLLDYALLGMQVASPTAVFASGGKYADPNGAAETPDTMTVVYEFDHFNIQWEHAIGIGLGPYQRNHGVAFIGDNGTLVLNRSGWEVIPEKDKIAAVPLQRAQDVGLDQHMHNFVAAIRAQDKSAVNAPIAAGAHIAKLSQMGNIAYRVGKKLYWSADDHTFTDEEANRFLTSVYHNGYQLPQV